MSVPLLLDLLLGLLLRVGILADGSVRRLVNAFQLVRSDTVFDEARELTLVRFFVLVLRTDCCSEQKREKNAHLQRLHVLGDTAAHDALAVSLSVILARLAIVAVEACLTVRNAVVRTASTYSARSPVRNVEAAVDSTLHRREHLRAGRRARQTDVKHAAERLCLAVDRFHSVHLARAFLLRQGCSERKDTLAHCSPDQRKYRPASASSDDDAPAASQCNRQPHSSSGHTARVDVILRRCERASAP